MKVIIAIDDSQCSDFAFQSVHQGCWPQDTKFIVVTVVEPFSMQYALTGADYVQAVAEAQRDYSNYCKQFINDKTQQLKNQLGAIQVEGRVLEGDIASTIILEAEKENADLIVIGSHGRRGLQKFLLGSVAEKVISHAPCSVQLVKQKLKTKTPEEKIPIGLAVS